MNILTIDYRTAKHRANFVGFTDGGLDGFITFYSSLRQVRQDLILFHAVNTSIHDASGKLIAYTEAGRVVFLYA